MSQREQRMGARICRRMLWIGLAACIPALLALHGCQARAGSVPTLTGATPLPSIASATPSPAPTAGESVTGDLAEEIRQLETAMPAARSGKYVRPSAKERKAFGELISSLQRGEMAEAAALARNNQYGLVRYLDEGNRNAANLLLRETISRPRGWGLYILRENPENHILIEAPHPLTDSNSAFVALDLYRALNARALLVAGSHRDANRSGSADVAHVTRTIFQSVHAALVAGEEGASIPAVILQVHGFAAAKHPGYPAVVLGAREKPSPEEISLSREIAEGLAAQGISAGVCEKDAWSDLCGTQNVQGSTSDGAIFLHIELSEAIRMDDRALVAVLSEILMKR